LASADGPQLKGYFHLLLSTQARSQQAIFHLMRKFVIKVLVSLVRALNSTPRGQMGVSHVLDTSSGIAKPQRVIVITTFSQRFEIYALPLIKNLRQAGVQEAIYVVINGDWDGDFNHEKRSTFLSELANIESCFPICLGSAQGMSQIWNAGLRLSDSNVTLVLNDDTNVVVSEVLENINYSFSLALENDLIILNGSFGHFIITRSCIRNIGWFDERFLGFGQEDGDYYWRFEQFYKKAPAKVDGLVGMSNASSEIGHEGIVAGFSGKYSLFNDVFLKFKYLFGSGAHAGMFGGVATKLLAEPSLLDLEHWRESLSELVHETDPSVIEKAISKELSRHKPID